MTFNIYQICTQKIQSAYDIIKTKLSGATKDERVGENIGMFVGGPAAGGVAIVAGTLCVAEIGFVSALGITTAGIGVAVVGALVLGSVGAKLARKNYLKKHFAGIKENISEHWKKMSWPRSNKP